MTSSPTSARSDARHGTFAAAGWRFVTAPGNHVPPPTDAYCLGHDAFGAVSPPAAPPPGLRLNNPARWQLADYLDRASLAAPPTTHSLDAHATATIFAFDDADWCLVGGVLPDESSAPPGAQADQVWAKLAAGLAAQGFAATDLVRTWFFCDRILDWYSDFNAARARFFDRQGVTRFPASTAVGLANPGGHALAAKALACRPRLSATSLIRSEPVNEVPFQGPAPAYGSRFSRAWEIVLPRHRRLFVSGTASIDAAGAVLFPHDVESQLARTVLEVEALLAARGYGWKDVARAVAYFPDYRDAPLLHRHFLARGLPCPPCALVQADVCRGAWRFELECEALRATT